MADPEVTDAISSGDHACLTYTDAEERLDLLAAFVRTGLRAGMKVLCWTDTQPPDGLAAELAARSVRAGAALKRGQLGIVPVTDALLGGARTDVESMIDVLAAELDSAGRDGYPGLRVTADMGWAANPLAAADQLMEFESSVGDLFTDGRLCLICQYDRDRFDAVTMSFAARSHAKTLAAQVYLEHPLLRICRQYSPPGLRIAGELDYRQKEVLEQALGESLRLDRHMHVNLSGLVYIDGACAATIVKAATRLSATRRMTLRCRRAVATVLDLVGANSIPQLRVQVIDAQR